MVLRHVAKKYRAWRIARNTRDQEFKPAQFSQGNRIGGLRYYTEGDDEAVATVVFVHGYTLAASSWHLQIATVAEQARCIAMDLRGHGKSYTCAVEECTIDGAADDVMTVLDDANITGPVILVGHSLGGMVVLNLLRRYPQFRVSCKGVVLVATSAQPFATDGMAQLLKLPLVNSIRDAAEAAPEESEDFRGKLMDIVAPVVKASAFSDKADRAMMDLHMKLINNTPLTSIIGFLDDLEIHDETEALEFLHGINGEIIVGDADLFTPVEQAEFISSNWPEAKLTIVPGAGHMLPLESHKVVTAAINRLMLDPEFFE
ncbi:MAG: alpha/beta hydrolase [Corynebacterium sp.]|uniref:alpha/beta fold hydrolase n=1 Tax=Corynebacterium sp. TaxID=1720 RepID=UPI0026DAF7E0|nr:alpha/beta hydrolase [Corynebacterium sp.]MDO5098627.1 alpha/beta hydrolase [Corynebacterium sp.]